MRTLLILSALLGPLGCAPQPPKGVENAQRQATAATQPAKMPGMLVCLNRAAKGEAKAYSAGAGELIVLVEGCQVGGEFVVKPDGFANAFSGKLLVEFLLRHYPGRTVRVIVLEMPLTA